jgi:hypothetical protein
MRHEDVHGVSGTGKVAEVFEASNGKCVVIWITPTPSVVCYDSIKAVEATHGHGGKTELVWDWESPKDPDPMDKVLNADKPALTDEEVEKIVEETAGEVASKVAGMVLQKVKNGDLEVDEEPKGAKKRTPAKKAPAKKKE